VFPGGDLGYLSVCGTVNDLAVAGARPVALTFALILEEGLDGALLEQLVAGAARAATEAGVAIVAGDTKVVPRGKGDRAFATTAGLGVVPVGRDLGDHRVAPGDVLLVLGADRRSRRDDPRLPARPVGQRLISDCAPLGGLVEALLGSGADVHAMHDPTRAASPRRATRWRPRRRAHRARGRRVPVRPEVIGVSELLASTRSTSPARAGCSRGSRRLTPTGRSRRCAVTRRGRARRRSAGRGAPAGAGAGRAALGLRRRAAARRPLGQRAAADLLESAPDTTMPTVDALSLNLLLAAAAIAVTTRRSPDHTLPFVMLARAQRWSRRKTLLVTGLCGLGHVASSLVLGAVGLALGFGVARVTHAEEWRGGLAAWALVVFGVAYGLWASGMRSAGSAAAAARPPRPRSPPRRRSHSHEHPGPDRSRTTFWALFVSSCSGVRAADPAVRAAGEPRPARLAMVTALVFSLVTIVTMLALVALLLAGVRQLPLARLERWSHALAGGVIAASGLAVIFLGL